MLIWSSYISSPDCFYVPYLKNGKKLACGQQNMQTWKAIASRKPLAVTLTYSLESECLIPFQILTVLLFKILRRLLSQKSLLKLISDLAPALRKLIECSLQS